MGDVVKLPGQPTGLEEDLEFISDLARFAEGIFSEKDVKKKHHLSADTWERLGSNDELVEKIEAEKVRRIRTGATKRERAQIEIVDAPPILGGIMRDPNANERHRIDSIKTLDALASTGAEAAAAGARFEITINLGADHIEHYSKSIAIDPDDTNPNEHRHHGCDRGNCNEQIKGRRRWRKDIFDRLNRERLQQDKEAIEQQRRNANPISQWAQECIDNNTIESGPRAIRCCSVVQSGDKNRNQVSLQIVRFVL